MAQIVGCAIASGLNNPHSCAAGLPTRREQIGQQVAGQETRHPECVAFRVIRVIRGLFCARRLGLAGDEVDKKHS